MSWTEQRVERLIGPITMRVADHTRHVMIFDFRTKLYLASKEEIVANAANPNSMNSDTTCTSSGAFT